jgi:hypothetical protein
MTIAVLTNTEGQNAYAITRALARAVLGLQELPAPAPNPEKSISDLSTSAEERAHLAGTFLLKLDRLSPNLHDSFAQYRRTYRVFDENGRLMIEALGGDPERLLKQHDGSFAMRSTPGNHITFVMQDGRATGIKMQGFGVPLSGDRVGDGDPNTFHRHLN